MLLLGQWAGATKLTSSDPYWIGDNSNFGTTEGNDFWLTFMRNGGTFDPETSPSIKFELKVAISARQETKVFIEIPGSTPIERTVPANETLIEDLSDSYGVIYMLESEVQKYKGVHVYTNEKEKLFSCFNYSRYGESGVSSRDASLIIPTKYMGQEYYVQTYYEDAYSSEFAIVATEDDTEVRITPNYQTLNGHAKGQTFTVNLLKKGDAYMVASASHQDNNVNVDLSGSQICATKPIAVFNGNQETSIPFHEANSVDYLSEQIIPITQWGTNFYLALLGNTKQNYTILTAAYDDTHVSVQCMLQDGTIVTEPIDLGKGQSSIPLPLGDIKEMVITSNLPIMCYYYTTSGGQNEERTGSIFNPVYIKYGDPGNALMPSWMHRVTSMNFFTHDLDPFVEAGKQEPPKKYYVYVVTKTADKGKITIDGTGDYSAQFHPFLNDPNAEMSYASIEVPNNGTHYHTIETTGDGFVGMVYAVTDAQGYLYTLGYNPEPFQDSLFVANTENVMSPKSYDVQPRLDQGWYQRQWDEWMKDHERLDTAQVCDGETVKWLLQSPISKQTDPVDWYIYDVTGTEKTIYKTYPQPIDSLKDATKDEETASDWLFRWEHKFEMPDESDKEPHERIPFLEYEIQAVLHHKHVICDLPDDLDTLRTVVRVTRIYHDTIYKIICMGDTLKCFNDSLPNQGAQGDPKVLVDQPEDRTDTKSETIFIGDKTEGESTKEFEWKARKGENEFRREYQTIFGCDSTYTLFLFVCDTFRVIDTIHLCNNEKMTVLRGTEHERIYRGIETIDPGILVTKDTVDTIMAKTKFCECQLEPYRSVYPDFEGCDSIIELHIFTHDISRDTIVDTMCYNRKPDSVYVWPIQKGTKEMHITKNHPNMEEMIEGGKVIAHVGFFSDTLRTTTCPKCNEGKGCDSIKVLKLIIPEPFYKEEKDSICLWHYDIDTRTTVPNTYRWWDHRHGADYVDIPAPGHYYDSCVTRFGCDSIYHLELKYTQPFLQVDHHAMATNQTYTWHGQTYGPYNELPEFKNIIDTTLYYHDIQANPKNGCDSIYRLELTLSDTYLFRKPVSICDIDSVHWRDTIVVGSKWQGSGKYNIRLQEGALTVNIDDSLLTVSLPQRDSIYRLIVTQYPTYDHTLPMAYVCQDQTTYDWTREDDGTLIQQIVLPIKSSYPFDTVYVDTLPTKTPRQCDSIVHLPIRICPTYDLPVVEDTICETNLDWSWYISDTYDSYSVAFPKRDLQQQPFDTTLTYTLHSNSPAQCDSIVRLHRVVKPVLRETIEKTLCLEQTPYPYGKHGKTASATGLYYDTVPSIQYGCDSITTYDITVRDKIITVVHVDTCKNELPYTHPTTHRQGFLEDLTDTGIYYDTISSLVSGCDSIIELHLNVWDTYEHNQFDTICDNGSFDFHGHIFENLPAKDTPYTFDSILTSIHGCDSMIHFYLTVHPTYDFPAVEDTICETDLDWSWYISDTYDSYSVAFPKRDLQQQPFDTTLTYTLHSNSPAHCDSIVRLHRVVKPVLRETIEKTLCLEQTPYPYGKHGKTASATGLYYDTVPSIQYGCDSITTYDITVRDKIITVVHVDTCKNELPYTHPTTHRQGFLEGLTDTGIYYDTISSLVSGCDSIIELHLNVWDTYEHDQFDTICDNGSFDFHGHIFENLPAKDTPYTFDSILTSIHGCDSMIHFHLTVHPTYDLPAVEDTICETDLDWSWYISDTYDSYSVAFPKRDLQQQPFDTTLTYMLHSNSPAQCDSIVRLHRVVKPVLRQTVELVLCLEQIPFEYGKHGKKANGSGIYQDTVPSIQYGCDSITTYDISVRDKIITVAHVDTCKNEVPYTHPTTHRQGFLEDLTTTGIYYDTISSLVSGCDSIIELHLNVWDTYEHNQFDTICDNGSFDFHGHIFENLSAKDTPYTFDSILTSIHGCDSMVHFYLTVHPTYDFPAVEDTICETDLDWSWYISDTYDSYSVNVPVRYLNQQLFDTTLTYMLHSNSPAQCDSIVRLHRVVKPVLYDTIPHVLCVEKTPFSYGKHGKTASVTGLYNDTVPSIQYGCDSITTYDITVLDKILTVLYLDTCDNEVPYNHPTEHRTGFLEGLTDTGIYYDTITSYLTGCDSILELHLNVWDTYDDPLVETKTCHNETFTWKLSDSYGMYEIVLWEGKPYDTIPLTAVQAVQPQPTKAAFDISRDTTLQTIHGCDSTRHIRLTVHPTYFFYTDTTICSSEQVVYRGKIFPTKESKDTTYTEVHKTVDGCDSIYQFHLHIKPSYLYTRYREVCDNETLIFPESGQKVWEPGDPLPTPEDHIDFTYATKENCDSTYRYFVTVHPTYYHEIIDTICSGDSVLLQGNHYVGIRTLFDVGTYHLPMDTTCSDTLPTIHGCDSIFTLKAHIKPQYYHLDLDTMCDNETVTWRAHTYENLKAGDYVTFDSLVTGLGCDSVYEFRLHVAPTYFFEEHITKCADEDMTWHTINLDHVEPGDHFFTDSALTVGFGCDSVYHLYLTVNDTTNEERYDTICRTEAYDLHGVLYYEPGDYKDTTTNEAGCHHFTYLHLHVIEPTVPTVWADSICADDQAYELYYTYTGEFDPIAYSVYYDETGHFYGFEDQENLPITTPEELHMLTIPMPLRDADKTKYPKPDYYAIRLVLDNGICTNPDLCATDTSIVLSYPSWITEQRFGDVIALYNERYNGGYYWDEYQWYHGDELLIGETHEYLYIPTGLIVGDQYYVRLTRTGETRDFQTCPITIVADPIRDDFSPKMGYLSVVPTCIVTGHPYANILSRKDGMYRVTSVEGRLVQEGVFRADVTEVQLPAVSGMYIFQLWSPDTPEEPYRSIKVIVKEKCEGCNIPF